MSAKMPARPAVYQDQDGSLWEVIGYITKPAAILRRVTDHVQHVEIIGCPNAERWTRLTPQDSSTCKKPENHAVDFMMCSTVPVGW
jgi:hypothetical protein